MIIGGFYFRLTESENLIGEYFNDYTTSPSTESADKRPNTGNGFEGVYDSSWFDGNVVSAVLTIGIKHSNKGVYSLSWDIKGNLKFFGEGIIVDKILMGNYIDDVVNNSTGLMRP